MKKVCIVFSNYYNAPNGASRFVKTLLNNKELFSNNGIDIDVVSRENIVPRTLVNGVTSPSKNKKLKSFIYKVTSFSPILTIAYSYFVDERMNRQIVKAYSKLGRNYDVIHFQEMETCYYYLKLYKKTNVKVFLTMHTDGLDFSMLYQLKPAFNSYLGKKYLYKKLNYVIKNADKIGFVSGNSMHAFSMNHPEIGLDKLCYVYNGIKDLAPLGVREFRGEQLVLISVGTICKRKNQESIIRALLLLSPEEQKRIKLFLAGDGPDLLFLKNLVANNNMEDVVFLGNCTNVDDYLSQSHIFILPSYNEGLPISIVEAMRKGLPIVGSNVAGIPEMINDGVSGYIIDPSVDSIKRVIEDLLKKTGKEIQSMGGKSRELFLERFLESNMINKYSQVYLSL